MASTRSKPEGFYVYLCSGEVCQVRPADSMEISPDLVVFGRRGVTVASFPRSAVFSCQTAQSSSPVLG